MARYKNCEMVFIKFRENMDNAYQPPTPSSSKSVITKPFDTVDKFEGFDSSICQKNRADIVMHYCNFLTY